MNPAKKKTRARKYILVALIVSILTVVYLLADRYLIEHVEVRVSDNQTTSISTDTTTNNNTVTNAATPTAASTGKVQSDDWNYKSDSVNISIKKVETGSGSNKITYFVADVQLKDSSSLQTAFAKNTFGRNIVETTSKIASDNKAIFAINGDYYGFRNDGVVIRNGTLYRDTPARTGLALLKNGTMKSFDETKVSSASLLAEGVTNTFSFGPALIQNGKVIETSGKVAVDTNFGNRSIQEANPRTGIGMISPNHYVFVVIDGRMNNYSRGMTLTEFTDVFADLGCTEAYNLDGGGSSTMYFMGRVVNNPLGKQDERAISDIIYIK